MQDRIANPHNHESFKRFEVVSLGFVLTASLIAFRSAFRCYFVQDDFGWLVLSRFNGVHDLLNCFLRFNPAGTYRPLSQETYFWLGQQLFGMEPWGFHLISMLAHLAAVCLLYFLLRNFYSRTAATVGSLLYAVHGIHVTPLCWISAFPEPLAMVFFLSAVNLFIRYHREGSRTAYVLSVVAMLLGSMSKESILSLPLILAAYCWIWARAKLPYTVPFFIVSGSAVILRTLGGVHWAPYDLSFGPATLGSLAEYLSWMAGFTGTVTAHFGWPATESTRWIALIVAVTFAFLLWKIRHRQSVIFGMVWMLCALQPVLYFRNHSYPYYTAPALAGFVLVIAAAIPDAASWKNFRYWIPGALIVCAIVWISYLTVKPEIDWWVERTQARKEFIASLLAIDRQVPDGATAYISGFGSAEFEKLENGGVFKAFSLNPRKFYFLFPEWDPLLPVRLETLKNSEDLRRAFFFRFTDGKWHEETDRFRLNPAAWASADPAVFRSATVRFTAGPSIIVRGRDTFTLEVKDLGAEAVDVLYSIDGQVMPPVLQWRLDGQGKAGAFADMTTPEGIYEFLAVRPSGAQDLGWIRVNARVTVR